MKLFTIIAKVAATDSTVMVHGETGTGKELIARAIHLSSPRRDRPMVPVNCGAIPEELLETELFGHEKGAFTNALKERQGRFELAQGGTIFLDEIGDMSPKLQVKLLRVLQEHEFEKVGGERTIHADIRVITATHVDLAKAVKEGRFREDLYYRLNVIPVTVPPLRDRAADIPLLIEFFLKRLRETRGSAVSGVSPAALALMCSYRWPGNIRELENLMERMVILADGDILTVEDLPAWIRPLPDPTDEARDELLKGFMEPGDGFRDVASVPIEPTSERTGQAIPPLSGNLADPSGNSTRSPDGPARNAGRPGEATGDSSQANPEDATEGGIVAHDHHDPKVDDDPDDPVFMGSGSARLNETGTRGADSDISGSAGTGGLGANSEGASAPNIEVPNLHPDGSDQFRSPASGVPDASVPVFDHDTRTDRAVEDGFVSSEFAKLHFSEIRPHTEGHPGGPEGRHAIPSTDSASIPEEFMEMVNPLLSFPAEGVNLKTLMKGYETKLIEGALKVSGGVHNMAAKLLGINRTTLQEKLKKK
jgi:DNA-binding NtrC family response regulator